MGKSRKQRAARRHNPVYVPDSHLPKGLEAAASTSSRKDSVLPIIQKLESPEAQERLWACSAVSNLIQNDPSTRRLLQGKNIVGALITRLTDSVEEIVVEAAGALRNLCIDGGFDICAEMYNKNILAPLRTFVPKISSALHELVTSPRRASDNAPELVYGLAENAITLIWCLSEISVKALNAINEMQLAPFLMSFLENREKLPSRTVAAAAQCLYVLTDDNSAVIDELRPNSSYITCLLAVSQRESAPVPSFREAREMAEDRLLSVRLLSAGTLKNISPIPTPSAASSIDIDKVVILPLVSPVLASLSLAEVTAKVPELLVQQEQEDPSISKPSLKNTPRSDHKSASERELEHILIKLRNIQLSLEILTGVCATLPDPELGNVDEEVNKDEDNIEDEDEDANSEIDMAMDASAPPPRAESHELQINGASSSTALFLPSIVPSLLSLIQPTALSFPPLSSSSATTETLPIHPPTTSALSAIHISALECLNNSFLALALPDSGAGAGTTGTRLQQELHADVDAGRRIWDALWTALAAVGLEGGSGQDQRREMWEVAVGVMWNVGIIWKGCIIPNEEQVQLLMQLCDASTNDHVKVKCIGALESLAQHAKSIGANRVISTYLLKLASSPPAATLSAESILQAASSLIDIYSDENMPYDINFRTGAYLQVLADSVGNVRRAVRNIDKKKEGGRELRERGEEVLENLGAFVRYRRDLKL